MSLSVKFGAVEAITATYGEKTAEIRLRVTAEDIVNHPLVGGQVMGPGLKLLKLDYSQQRDHVSYNKAEFTTYPSSPASEAEYEQLINIVSRFSVEDSLTERVKKLMLNKLREGALRFCDDKIQYCQRVRARLSEELNQVNQDEKRYQDAKTRIEASREKNHEIEYYI